MELKFLDLEFKIVVKSAINLSTYLFITFKHNQTLLHWS